MPSLVVGPFKIVSISGGTVNFGDTGFIAPKAASKAYTGSGGSLTGDFPVTISGISNTNTIDVDAIDDNVATGF